MNRSHIAALLLCSSTALALACGPYASQPAAAKPAAAGKPAAAPKPVDIAICLDTSGSMDGLIDAARQRLWDIVNDLATATPRPALRVALLSYGNDGYAPETGWVRTLQPFTTDLDAVSQQLFALTTNGGTEYDGRVVNQAATTLDWSADAGALKLIVVAGNEGAAQDPGVTHTQACRTAISKGIIVNAIYCGGEGSADAPGWREVAKLADGEFIAIDQNKNDVIPTPHDEKLAELSTALNTTYIPLGVEGRAGAMNQAAQDANAAAAAPAVAAERAATKSGTLYNASWDLLDRLSTGPEESRVKLEEVKDAELPEAMRAMTLDQRRAHVTELQTKRTLLQKEVAELNQQRQAFIEAERQKQADANGAESFQTALRKAVRQQAAKKGFAWEK